MDTSNTEYASKSTEGEDTCVGTDIYPTAPYKGGCRMILNEFATKNDDNQISFIEHVFAQKALVLQKLIHLTDSLK